jgi:hypothetical protein
MIDGVYQMVGNADFRAPHPSCRSSESDSTTHGTAVHSPLLRRHVVILRKRATASEHVSVSRWTAVYHCSGVMDPSTYSCCW